MSGILIPIAAFLFVNSKELVTLIVGSSWSSITLPFSILSLSVFFRGQSKISDSLARGVGFVYSRSGVQLCYSLIIVFGSIAVAFKYGLIGVTIYAAVCYFAYSLAMSFLVSAKCFSPRNEILKIYASSVGIFTISLAIFAIFKQILYHMNTPPVFILIIASIVLAMIYFALINCYNKILNPNHSVYIDSLLKGSKFLSRIKIVG